MYWLPFRSFGTIAPSNSMGVRKCRGHPQATLGLEYSRLFLPHRELAYLRLTPFIGRNFHSSVLARFGMTLVQFWRYLFSHGVMTLAHRLLGLKTPVLKNLVKFYLSQSILLEWSRRIQSKLVHNPTWYASSLEGSGSPTRIHLCYQCIYSTLASILPMKFKYLV